MRKAQAPPSSSQCQLTRQHWPRVALRSRTIHSYTPTSRPRRPERRRLLRWSALDPALQDPKPGPRPVPTPPPGRDVPHPLRLPPASLSSSLVLPPRVILRFQIISSPNPRQPGVPSRAGLNWLGVRSRSTRSGAGSLVSNLKSWILPPECTVEAHLEQRICPAAGDQIHASDLLEKRLAVWTGLGVPAGIGEAGMEGVVPSPQPHPLAPREMRRRTGTRASARACV